MIGGATIEAVRTGITILALATAGLAAAVAANMPASAPRLINRYESQRDADLPLLPSGFVRNMSFAFSPDDQWIAVVVGTRATDPEAPLLALPSTLLLLPVHPSEKQPVHINPGVPLWWEPHWSPGSDSVAVQAIRPTRTNPPDHSGTAPALYDLRGRLQWTGPPAGAIIGFVRPGVLLARHADGKAGSAGFDSIEVGTSALTPWPVSRHWRVEAASPDRQLVAVFSDSEGSKTLIVDYASGKVLQSVKNQLSWRGSRGISEPPAVYFAENGSTICFAPWLGEFQNHASCLDVDGGKTVGEFHHIQTGMPAQASAGGSRMLLSSFFPRSGNVVWDFRTGTEVATLKPPTDRFNSDSAPMVISSTGRYVALSVGDELRIYELPQ